MRTLFALAVILIAYEIAAQIAQANRRSGKERYEEARVDRLRRLGQRGDLAYSNE